MRETFNFLETQIRHYLTISIKPCKNIEEKNFVRFLNCVHLTADLTTSLFTDDIL